MSADANRGSVLCSVGQYWLSSRPNSKNLYICWYDRRTRQVIRKSTGTSEIEKAEDELAFIHLSTPDHLAPAKQRLYSVLLWYWDQHGSRLISANATSVALRYWIEYFEEKVLASEVTPIRMRAFWEYLRKLGLSEGSISRITGVGRAAINLAHQYRLIRERPRIPDNQRQFQKESVEPKGRPLQDCELARILSADKPEYLQSFLMITVNTLCRTRAALDLKPSQVNFKDGEVQLNPPGRIQTKKYRPLVPLTNTLAEYLEDKRASPYVSINGATPDDFYEEWRRMLLRAKLPIDDRIVPYSIRHTMGRVLRRRRVPLESIGLYMGHKRRGAARTTAIYAPYVPDDLRDAAAVIDEYVRSLSA